MFTFDHGWVSEPIWIFYFCDWFYPQKTINFAVDCIFPIGIEFWLLFLYQFVSWSTFSSWTLAEGFFSFMSLVDQVKVYTFPLRNLMILSFMSSFMFAPILTLQSRLVSSMTAWMMSFLWGHFLFSDFTRKSAFQNFSFVVCKLLVACLLPLSLNNLASFDGNLTHWWYVQGSAFTE